MTRIAEILALLANPEGVTDTQLADLEAELLTLFDDRLSENAPISELTSIVETTEQVRELAAERLGATDDAEGTPEERAAALAALSTRLGGPEDDEPDDEPDPEEEVAPVTAGGSPAVPAVPRRRLSLRDRAPAALPAPAAASAPTVSIVASGDVPGFSAGEAVPGMSEVFSAMAAKYNGIRSGGKDARFDVVRFEADYDDAHTFTDKDVTREVAELHRALMAGGDALTADGGICAPTEPWYGFEYVSSTRRPVRDSLVRRKVPRGGINYSPPPTLSDIGTTGGSPNQAIGTVTETQDAAGATDKTYQVISCDPNVEVQVEANYLQLEFGNFGARTWPEQTQVWTQLALAASARYNESRILAKIVTGSVAVSDDAELGASRDVVNALNRAAVAYRRRHRMEETVPLRVMLPDWLPAVFQNDIRTAMNSELGMLSVQRSWINTMMASINVNVTWHMDGHNADQTFAGSQGAGVLKVFPTTVAMPMFHEGAWWHIDNGVLDLGLVRDSTLNTSNNFRTFTETFENVALLGVESIVLTHNICANGLSAGTKDTSTYCGS